MEKEKLDAEKKSARSAKDVSKTPAAEQLDIVGRLIQNLNRIHKRG